MTDKPFDPTKPVQTRDGRVAEIVRTNVDHPDYPILALIRSREGRQEGVQYTNEGRRYGSGHVNGTDLVNVPEKIVRWVNFYPIGSHYSGCHISRETADKEATRERIACRRIEFIEGQFDE